MCEGNLEYLRRRAEEELASAQRSGVPAAVAAHYELAELYLARISEQVEGEAREEGPAGSVPDDGNPPA